MKRLATTLLTYAFLSLSITAHADQITPSPESSLPPAVMTAVTEQASGSLIHAQTANSTFQVVEAFNGTLDADALSTQATVKVAYPTLDARDTVGIRWGGIAVRDSPIQTATSSGELNFAVPKAWVSENIGRSVTLTYSYKEGGTGALYTSAPINLQIAGTTPIGQQVAVNLNARFKSTVEKCSNDTPAYYCSGVMLRSTETGNYDPWDPSPSAVKLDGVSFSYIRSDAYVNSFYHNHGFVFLPQEQAIAKGQAPDYLCIYAYDAGTIVGARSDKGCGLKVRSLNAADLSSCSAKGVRTPAQWYAYTQEIPNRDYQCSLSTKDAVQFATSLKVRASKPNNMDSIWNEVMVKTWPQGAGVNLPIEAFFYTDNGLSGAKTAQTKFKQKTNLVIPIVRVDFSKSASGPFSYEATDQAVQP